MKSKKITLLSFFMFACVFGMAQNIKTEVFIISTIHGAHKVNPNYTYDSLFAFIDKFNPDIIGVEIRAEDIDSTESYLKNNYPYEMYVCRDRYPSKSVMGFDWLGDELAGKAIPKNYWKEKSPVKLLQKQLAADSAMLKKMAVLDIVSEEKDRLALTASLRELNDGRYDLINRIYYEQLKFLLNDTAYKLLSDFYSQRDESIAQHILEIIESNAGKKMIFLLGADHRDHTLRRVSSGLKTTIILNDFD